MTATNESLSKNGKDTVTQFPESTQIYVGNTKAEDYFTPDLVKNWSANRVRYNTAESSGNKRGFTFDINSANYLWGTFMVHTRYSIHTLVFATNGSAGITVKTKELDTSIGESLTVTVSGRTVTVMSGTTWNYFDIDGVSSQPASDFNFTTILAS